LSRNDDDAEDRAVTHVIPTNEEEMHERSTACDCEPEIDTSSENGDIMVVHASFEQSHLLVQAESVKQTVSLRLIVEQGWQDTGARDATSANELWRSLDNTPCWFSATFANWVRENRDRIAEKVFPPTSER
jgi:hypothetical protein